MKTIRAVCRLLLFFACTLWAASRIVLGALFARDTTRFGIRMRREYARLMLPLLGVRCTIEGELPEGPCIIMGNHRSYLDPVMVALNVAAVPVSKAELAKWPVIGFAAKASGVIFLQRESQTSRKRTLDAIAVKVKEGHVVVLFPEGTTHSKPTTIAFRRGGFQLASKNAISVVPLALDFKYAADNWIDDDTFIGHFLRRFGEKQTLIRLAYGPPIYNPDPDLLLQDTQSWIDERLEKWHAEGWNQ